MNWRPWRTRPGMVRVSHRTSIALLRDALRARDLESAIQVHTAEAKGHDRCGSALEHLSGRGLPVAVVSSILDDLPQRADGSLHVEAFKALVEEHEWRLRLNSLSPAGAAGTDSAT